MPYVDGEWVSEEVHSMFKEKNGGFKPGWISDTGYRFKKAVTVEMTLPPAVYSFAPSDQGLFFEKKFFPTDRPAILPGLPHQYILDQIKTFWSKKDIYREHGLLHKRGIFMYGNPGCGKTSIIRLLCDEILKMNGIIFTIDDFKNAGKFISEFRSAEPERPILTIQEDIEGFFDGSAGPDQLKAALSFLDGENQANNIVHLATSNEPEKLADRFIKRPGRFDLIVGIHAPSEETRRAYLEYVDPNLKEDVLNDIVTQSKGLSLAYLRELISTYVCLGIPLEETIKRLKSDSKKKLLKNPKNGEEKFGFTVGYEG